MNEGVLIQNKGRERALLWFILICLLWMLAVSGRSLWLDEAHGAGWKANQASLAEWWQDDVAQKGGFDSQIAGYLLYIWGYAKVFGASEWALRAANLPWVFLGFWVWLSAFRPGSPSKWGVAVAAASSPFLWYYLDEARPYAMQVGSGFLLAGALHRLYLGTRADRLWVGTFCFGLLALSASNLLGEIWAGAAAGTALGILGWQRSWQLVRKHLLLCLSTLALLTGMGLFYLWTLKSGSRATSVGSTDAKNFAFIGYELLGFSGLGPSRLDIRGSGFSSFRPFAGWLVAYAMVLAPVVFAGAKQVYQSVPRRVWFPTLLFFGAASAFISLVGITAPFRILGRHFTPLVVLVICLLGLGAGRMWASGKWWKWTWIIFFVALSLASCLFLRFAPRHGKDDYRGAAALARAALQQGKVVWWNADQRGAGYYQVPTTVQKEIPKAAWYLLNPGAEELKKVPAPDLVVTSKPDVYDLYGTVAEYLHTNRFQVISNLPAFTIWQRTPAAQGAQRDKAATEVQSREQE